MIVLLNLITHRTNSAAGPAYNPSLLPNFDFFAHAENKRALGTETKSGMRGQQSDQLLISNGCLAAGLAESEAAAVNSCKLARTSMY